MDNLLSVMDDVQRLARDRGYRSMAAFLRASGVSQSTWSRWASGARRPMMDTLDRLRQTPEAQGRFRIRDGEQFREWGGAA